MNTPETAGSVIVTPETCIRAETDRVNADGTFTVHYGSKSQCGDVPNRLDVTEGWNFLMRIHRPGLSVIDGSCRLPPAQPVR